jgi:hypothetical protein
MPSRVLPSLLLQFVFTLPKALRIFLRHDQRLFAVLSRLIFSLIAEFHFTAAGRPITTAALVAYQPFADFNPHFHTLPGGWVLYHTAYNPYFLSHDADRAVAHLPIRMGKADRKGL